MRELLEFDEVLSGDIGMSLDKVLVRVPGPATVLSDGLGLKPGGMRLMRVKTGHYEFAVGINTQAVNDSLVVSFHGVRNDDDEGASAFRLLTWSAPLESAVLAISDPTCESVWPGSAPRLSGFWCEVEPLPDAEINALIDRAAAELGIGPDRVVLCGLSIGAAPAIRLGAARPHGRVIVYNAVTEAEVIRRYVDAWLRQIRCPNERFEALRKAEPWRFDALAAWQRGLAEGRDLRMLVVQGLRDRLTTREQFPRFCQVLGLDAERGGPSADGRVLLLTNEGGKHGLVPTLAIHQMARQVFMVPPQELAGLTLQGLRPGTWTLDEDVGQQFFEAQQARRELRRDQEARGRVAEPPAGDRPMQAMAPAGAAGVLILTGSPAIALKRWMHLLATLPDSRRIQDTALTDGLRENGVIYGTHLLDEQGVAVASDSQWLLGSMRRLFEAHPEALSALPEARAVYLLRNPMEAVAQVLAGDDGSLDDRLSDAMDEWNRSVRSVLAACRGPDGARIRVVPVHTLEDPQALVGLLAWLGRAVEPKIERRSARTLAHLHDDAAWPVGLDAGQRSRLLLGLDWEAYRQLSAPR